jgi:hypothetical protein
MNGVTNLFVSHLRCSPVPPTHSELVQNRMDEPGELDNITADAEYHRQLRRAAQQERRSIESPFETDSRRQKNSASRRIARSLLSEDRRIDIQRTNTANRAARRSVQSTHSTGEVWWNRVAALDASEAVQPLRLRWNRTCKICGIKVRYKSGFRYS